MRGALFRRFLVPVVGRPGRLGRALARELRGGGRHRLSRDQLCRSSLSPLVTMLRLLPMGLLGVLFGAVVERFDRRLMLAAMMALLALTSGRVLAIVAALGALQVWHPRRGRARQRASAGSPTNPLRRTMMGDSVGRERMPVAMAFLDIVAQNVSRHDRSRPGRPCAGLGRDRGRCSCCRPVSTSLPWRRPSPCKSSHGAGVCGWSPCWRACAKVLAAVAGDRRLAAILAAAHRWSSISSAGRSPA